MRSVPILPAWDQPGNAPSFLSNRYRNRATDGERVETGSHDALPIQEAVSHASH